LAPKIVLGWLLAKWPPQGPTYQKVCILKQPTQAEAIAATLA